MHVDPPQLLALRRFIERRIAPDLNSGCWLWTGAVADYGYGRISVKGPKGYVAVYAHRASWMVHRGPIPAGMKVCHRCDTPACVNPDHLFLGTQRDNMRDMFAKGRHQRHGQKFTDDQVRAIRLDGRSCAAIANDHGVDKVTVWLVKQRRTYAKVA